MAPPRSLMNIQYVHDMDCAVAFLPGGLSLVTQSPGWSMLPCGGALRGLHGIYAGVAERPAPTPG